MIYLMSTEVGWDAQGIGFPSVMTCIAFVLATSTELIGWHSFNTPEETMVANSEAFARYALVKQHSAPVHLYAASSSRERGNVWKKVTIRIARRLNYEGPVTIFDTGLLGGTYFEFRLANGGATIQYKKNAKMQYPTTSVNASTTRHKRIVPSPRSGIPRYKHLYGGEDGQAVIHTQPLVVNSNSGQLKPPPPGTLTTFNVGKSWGKIREI
jgi:hypothetical protein